MLGLMSYTFVTMVGGNPKGNAYGFTYWQNPVSSPSSLSASLTLCSF